MATLYDATQKISEAMHEAVYKIGTGECVDQDGSTERTALLYRQRIGEVDGLKMALDIIAKLQKGEDG